MRYLLLIYSKAESEVRPIAERDYTRHFALMEEATRRGVFVGAEPLAPPSTAKTVRVENGKPIVTDGPFPETKEQLAGYYMVDCNTVEEAVEWAAKIPGACNGSHAVEIRAMPGIPGRAREDTAVGQVVARG